MILTFLHYEALHIVFLSCFSDFVLLMVGCIPQNICCCPWRMIGLLHPQGAGMDMWFEMCFHEIGLPRWHSHKEFTWQCRKCKRAGSIPGSGRAPEAGNGHPFQYSCLEMPWTEEPGGLQSIGLQRVRRDWLSNWARTLTHTHRHTHTHTYIPWNRIKPPWHVQVRSDYVTSFGHSMEGWNDMSLNRNFENSLLVYQLSSLITWNYQYPPPRSCPALGP